MRLIAWSFAGAACAAAMLVSPSAKAANVPLCLAIAQNYNNCMREHQLARRDPYGYGRGYPGGPYMDDDGYDGDEGRGYGPGYGGYGPGYGGYGGYRRHGYGRGGSACAAWFVQMQASGCFN